MNVEILETTVEKRLTPRERDEPEAAAQLHSEAALLVALRGTGLAPRLLASGADFLRLERLPFPTLAMRMEQGVIDKSWLGHAAIRAFEALARLHGAKDERGWLRVVHADLSPGNLVIEDAAVVFLDFGLSAWRQSPPRDGAFRGTLAYAAPEIARGEPPTPTSDVFALAASFVHALRGAAPRVGASFAAVLARAAEEPLDTTGLDPGLAACLAHDPSERPAAHLVSIASQW